MGVPLPQLEVTKDSQGQSREDFSSQEPEKAAQQSGKFLGWTFRQTASVKHFKEARLKSRGGGLSGRASGDGTEVTERAQNADFRRKPQVFADSPLLLEIQAFGGRRKPQIFAENCRKLQIGLRHLRSVTFSSPLLAGADIHDPKRGYP